MQRLRTVWMSLSGLAAGMALAACQSDLTGRDAAGQAALATGYPFGTHRSCDGEVARQLQANGIPASAVDNIWYQDQMNVQIGGDHRQVGYDAFVRLNDQTGLVVIDLTAQCFARQVYTRDGLVLPEISAF